MLSKTIATNRLFLIILAMYIGASLWMIFEVPGLIAPNEGLHYEYVALMRTTGQLPDAATSLRNDERRQPPVYYAIGALLSLPFQQIPQDGDFISNPFYIATHRGNLNVRLDITPETAPVLYAMRIASLLFGIAGVIAVYACARLTLSLSASLLAAALTAFQPMYLFLSAGAINDLAVTGMSAIVLSYGAYLIVRKQKPLHFLWLGVLVSLAVLTKTTAALLVLILPICCLADWARTRRISRMLLDGVLGIAGLTPLYGAWLYFNYTRGLNLLDQDRLAPVLRLLTISPSEIIAFAPNLERIWRSFWMDWSPGEYGYAPAWIYLVCGVALIFLTSGWLFTIKRRQANPLLPWMHLLWSGATIVAFLAVMIVITSDQGYFAPEGRLLLLVMPSLAWFVSVGWAEWEKRLPAFTRNLPAFGIALAGIALTIRYIPVLFPHMIPMAALPDDITVANIRYSDKLELLGVSAPAMTGERSSVVQLYWRAPASLDRNYTVSAQLLAPNTDVWTKLDMQNSYPGNGLNPTTSWSPGMIYRDQVTFQPMGTLNGPTRAFVTIYVLDENLGTMSMSHNGAPLQIPIAQEVTVRPQALPARDQQDTLISPVNFGSLMQLDGLRVTGGATTTQVALWWKATADIDKDYTVFVHLLDANGRTVTQYDSYPDAARTPTHLWRNGDTAYDVHLLSGLVPTGGTLEIGVYYSQTGKRLTAVQTGVNLTDDILRIDTQSITHTTWP